MAELAVQNMSSEVSLTPVLTTPTEFGDYFVNDGKTFLYVKNTNTTPSSMWVTIISQVPDDQGTLHHVVVAVPYNSEKLVGFFNTSRFNYGSEEVMVFVCSATVKIKVAAIRVN